MIREKIRKKNLPIRSLLRIGRSLYKKGKTNYFLSVWIANFGVVPLLRLAAFLLAPAFFNLAALFVFVTRVFETIKLLLFPHFSHLLINRSIFLAIKAPHVKKLLLFSIVFLTNANAEQIKSLQLPLYQYKLIPFHQGQRYIIANKKHLKVKYLADKQQLLLKALRPLHSDLIILDNKKAPLHYSITTPQRNRPGIYELKDGKKILNKLYFYLFQSGLNDFRCFIQNNHPVCFIDQNTTLPKSLKNMLSKQFHASFYPIDPNLSKFYHLSFELILVEKNGGEQIKMGIDQIDVSPSDLSTLKQSLGITLKNENLRIRSLSKQKVLLSAGVPSKISVGGEIHYESTYIYSDKKNKTNHWKFMGLQSKLKVFQKNGELLLQYSNSFSRPTNSLSYHSEKQQGVTSLPLNKTTVIFEVSYVQKQSLVKSIPYLQEIPILKQLFSSLNSSFTQKKIVALITLKEKE